MSFHSTDYDGWKAQKLWTPTERWFSLCPLSISHKSLIFCCALLENSKKNVHPANQTKCLPDIHFTNVNTTWTIDHLLPHLCLVYWLTERIVHISFELSFDAVASIASNSYRQDSGTYKWAWFPCRILILQHLYHAPPDLFAEKNSICHLFCDKCANLKVLSDIVLNCREFWP